MYVHFNRYMIIHDRSAYRQECRYDTFIAGSLQKTINGDTLGNSNLPTTHSYKTTVSDICTCTKSHLSFTQTSL